MTPAEKIAQVLRDAGAAYVEFDDSATDGNCWIVEQKDGWYLGVAEAVLSTLIEVPETEDEAFALADHYSEIAAGMRQARKAATP